MICTNCRKNYADDMNFCPYCGTQKNIADNLLQEKTNTCKKCDAEISEGMAFCPVCGENQNNSFTDSTEPLPLQKFCKNCGKELSKTTIFCPHCGTNQTITIKTDSKGFRDGITLLKSFFSKRPFWAVEKAGEEQSIISFCVLYIILNIALFAFVSCHSIAQSLNYLISCANDLVGTLIDSASGDILASLTSVASFKMSASYSLFLPFALIGLITLIIEFVGIYLLLIITKHKPASIVMIINSIAVAGFPIAPALIISFITGFFFPPLSLCIFLTVFIIHIILLYKSVQVFFKSEELPIWHVSATIFVIFSLITIIIVKIIMSSLNGLVSDAGGYILETLLPF